MSLILCPLASGSRGNALWAETPGGAVLVDCGLGPRDLRRRLADRGLDERRLLAVLVTHEHHDHVRGLAAFTRGRRPVLHLTRGAYRALGGVPGAVCRRTQPGVALAVAGLTVTPFAVPHDASEPVAYRLEHAGAAALVVTDLGTADALPPAAWSGLDWLLAEANHDEALLRDGPYPTFLKTRIAGDTGHLSNRQCAGLVARALAASPRLRRVTLGHLSETNNDPTLARDTVWRETARLLGTEPALALAVAAQHAAGEPVALGGDAA